MRALEKLFQKLSQAIQSNDESEYRNLWHPESYTRNLVGANGWSGDAVFTQAANGRWTLLPEFGDVENLENPTAFLVGCYIQNQDQPDEEAEEYVYALIGQDAFTKNLWLLGVGENREEVLGLWTRLNENEDAPVNGAESEPEEKFDNISPILSTEEAALAIITQLNETLKSQDEQAFADHWIFRGYKHNLVGESGLPGHEFYIQAAAGIWQLKPLLEYASMFDNPEGILIPCQIWLGMPDMPKADDERYLLLVNSLGKLKALGIGSNITELRHLFLSYKGEVMA